MARPDELERLGPGVARVDLNSAIVLERRSLSRPRWQGYYNRYRKREGIKGKLPRARVEGPGVVFTEPHETIRGIADLRPQFRLRPGIQAYTRDGIEINNPVWVLWDGEFLLFSLTTTRQKHRNLLREPRISVALTDDENPRRYLEVRGEVERIEEDIDNAFVDGIAQRFIGIERYTFDPPGAERVVVYVRPLHTSKMG